MLSSGAFSVAATSNTEDDVLFPPDKLIILPIVPGASLHGRAWKIFCFIYLFFSIILFIVQKRVLCTLLYETVFALRLTWPLLKPQDSLTQEVAMKCR